MREADRVVLVNLVQLLPALASQLAAVVDRLAASSGAAAGTCHDLHEIILHGAAADGADQLPRVAKTAGHRGVDDGASDVEVGLLPPVQAAHTAEGVGVGVLSGHDLVAGAERRLHHAAGGAEDDGCPGAGAEGRIKILLRKRVHIDLLRFDQTADLAGGQHIIHVLGAA